MALNSLFAEGYAAGCNWRTNPTNRDFTALPYYRQNSEHAQAFNRAFTCGLQSDPSIDIEQAYKRLLEQRPDLAPLYGEAAH